MPVLQTCLSCRLACPVQGELNKPQRKPEHLRTRIHREEKCTSQCNRRSLCSQFCAALAAQVCNKQAEDKNSSEVACLSSLDVSHYSPPPPPFPRVPLMKQCSPRLTAVLCSPSSANECYIYVLNLPLKLEKLKALKSSGFILRHHGGSSEYYRKQPLGQYSLKGIKRI